MGHLLALVPAGMHAESDGDMQCATSTKQDAVAATDGVLGLPTSDLMDGVAVRHGVGSCKLFQIDPSWQSDLEEMKQVAAQWVSASDAASMAVTCAVEGGTKHYIAIVG